MCGLPNWLEMAIERTVGPSYRVSMEGRVLLYEALPGDGTRVLARVRPTAQEWRDFMLALEAVDLWHWAAEYRDGDSPTPATRWYIELTAPGRQLNTAGADAYPTNEAFPRFCAALRVLLGGRVFA